MKIFLIGWDNTSKETFNVALGLQKGGYEILYWTRSGRQGFEVDSPEFNNTIFHRHPDAVRGIPAKEFDNEEFMPPGEDLIKQFYGTESVLTTMKQFEKLSPLTLKKKHQYYCFLQYWHGVIRKLKPDAIIFALWPHSGYNFVIYALSKRMGIKTVMFEFTRIGDRLLLINDYKIGSIALKEEIKNNKHKQFNIENLDLDIRECYKQQLKDSVGITTPDMEMFAKKYSGINLLIIKLKVAWTSVFDFSIVKKVYNYLFKKYESNLKKEYVELQTMVDSAKRDQKYIYVALHYQPECSTSPLGGIFVDQILMINILSAAIPDDWLIYAKEHPAQWMPSGLSYSSFRYEGYYKEIAKFKNVRLVPIDEDNIKLVRNSQAVATVTGTAGWEAVLRLKPALVFGYSWYRDCPGIFQVNSVESCQKAIGRIMSDFKINNQDIINHLAIIGKVSFQGYFEKWAKDQSKITEAECTRNILNALIKEIEKK